MPPEKLEDVGAVPVVLLSVAPAQSIPVGRVGRVSVKSTSKASSVLVALCCTVIR